jgi:hypothetical protein
MIDINPKRCIRAAEEMSITRRTLLQAADSLTDACSGLRSIGDDSMLEIARKVERYTSDIQYESRIADSMSLILEKIAETYIRTENDTCDYIDHVRTEPVTYSPVTIRAVTDKAGKYFEDF